MPNQPGWPWAANASQLPIIQPTPISEHPDLEDKAWRLYVRGRGPHQIAKALNQSPEWGELTIRRLLEQREIGYLPMVRAHVEKLLDEINLIRQAAWSGWYGSRKDKVRTVEKTKDSGQQGRAGSETVVTTEPQCGDASFLRTLTECNKRESGLRGIEKPTAVRLQLTRPPVDIDTLIQQVQAVIAMETQRQGPEDVLRETASVEPSHTLPQEAQL